MTVFTTKEDKTVNKVFRIPVDTSTGPKGLLRSEFVREQSSLLFPLVSGTSKEEVDQFLSAGMVGPLESRAESITAQKRQDIYTEIFEVSALSERSPEQAIAELESLREDNPFLKAYVSPGVIEALKQSDSQLAREMAQGKLANAVMAIDIINSKMSEASTGFVNGVGDFLDVLGSDLPIVSAFNVKRRKELSDKFLRLLESTGDPAVIRADMEAIVSEAADMGFFTDSNRFYLNDFLGLTQEQGKGGALATQQAFAAIDILASLAAVGDTGKLIGLARGSSKETSEALMAGVVSDTVGGAVDPAGWKESILTPGRTTPRSPVEATAVKNVELELRASQEVLAIRTASGSAIDDETFVVVKDAILAKSKKRAEEKGNFRYVDADVVNDGWDNIQLVELYGTTKGKAFAGNKFGLRAAQIYADQILGEVVAAPGGYVVKKATNVPTGAMSQGAKTEDIIKDLGLFTSLDEDELGSGFFARWGSPLSQTDPTNNAVLKQGEFARSIATSTLERDVERQLRIVGKDGKAAVERVYTELRDGQFSSMRDAPTVEQFQDMFFKINARMPTPAETRLHELKLKWNNDDWFLNADLMFKKAVNRGVEILVPQDGIEVGAVKTTREANTGRQVWDADSKAYTPIDLLPEDRDIYKLVEPMEFDGKLHDLVASAAPKTRALKHTDVMGYNAGGSRLYAPNRSNFIVKQETEYALADGVTRQGVPRTLMVTKTEKEAKKAVTELNNVVNALHAKVKPGAFTQDEYLRVITTKYKDNELNDIISRNSAWNTDVHSIETLVEWAGENNVDLRKTVQSVSDGQPLTTLDSMIGDVTFKEVAGLPGPLKMGDFRKDNVLMGYGGQRVPTIPPFEAISQSLMSSVARQTNTAYETRAIMRLYRTALEGHIQPGGKRVSYLSHENIALIRNMSLRQKAHNMKIDTGTSMGKKLELERKKIIARLEGQKMIDVAYHKRREAFADILYDRGSRKTAEKIDALSADPNAATKGIVFEAYMGLGAIDQLWVQASQMLSIMGMADKTIGVQASAIAPFFRGTLLNGHKAPSEAMAKLMGGAIGVTPEHMMAIVDTFKKSGKGFVNASVADLGEDSGGKIAFRKLREVGRIGFTEGELLSRITAHIAASMDYIKKFGTGVDLNSQHATRWVMHESDKLTMAMSSTSRNTFEQIPGFQFLTYPMHVTEYMLGGIAGGKKVLTTRQKIKFGLTQLAFFGVVAIPGGGWLLDKYNREYGTNLTEGGFYSLRHGIIDNAIRYLTGVETEIGTRLAWGEGLFNTMADFQDKTWLEVISGPAGSLAVDVWGVTGDFIKNINSGGISAIGQDELFDVFRLLKSGNMVYNGWLAFQYEMYRSKSGDMIADDITTGEGIALALGVPLNKVNEYWRETQARRNEIEDFKSVAKEINKLYQDWFFERKTNGYGTKQEKIILGQLEWLYKLHQEDMPEIKRFINKEFITKNEQMTIELAKRDAERRAKE